MKEGEGTLICRISRIFSDVNSLIAVYSAFVILAALIGILMTPGLSYDHDQLYPKNIDRQSPLDPYDRGGVPFEKTYVKAQYPENSPYLGYVTAYLTPLSEFMAENLDHFGTTIVSHPGGIIDEILYNTRGLDTVVETSVLFVAFAVAAFLIRRDKE